MLSSPDMGKSFVWMSKNWSVNLFFFSIQENCVAGFWFIPEKTKLFLTAGVRLRGVGDM